MEKVETPPLNCKEYGRSYGKLGACNTCFYADYCRDSTNADKQHVDYTTKDKHGNIENIATYEKASNVSGQLIAELLEIADFHPIRFFVLICRLGNLTYKQAGDLIGFSDVKVFKYAEKLPQNVKKYLKEKNITMRELEEAFDKEAKRRGIKGDFCRTETDGRAEAGERPECRLIKQQEAIRRYDVSRYALHRAKKAGKVIAFNPEGGNAYIDQDSLERWLMSRKSQHGATPCNTMQHQKQ